MPRLKDRQRQIPNGLRMQLPEVRWQSAPYSSFDTIVNQIFGIVRSNPELAAKHGWPADRPTIADWVDETNAAWCQQNGWTQYYVDGGGPPPKPMAPGLLERLKSVAGAVIKVERGIETLLDWETSGLPPVSEDLSNWRASICVQCPKNGKGDLTRWFTVPASEQIRSHMERLHKLELKTFHDEKLGVCEMCLCALKLKVHAPAELVKKHLDPALAKELPPNCWMLK